MKTPSVAVLIPCYNEALTIGKVVKDFQKELPEATIYVFDNNSTDDSATLAAKAGATVFHEKKQGKGFVVATMLNTIAADYYVMVDGDDTYPADNARKLLEPLFLNRADMTVGQRLSTYTMTAFRPLHVFGNRLVVNLINLIFGSKLSDVMSGYRAFTREVALALPVVATGFDLETEMTLQLLYRHCIIQEVPIPYKERPEGSSSKLSTFRDGIRVLVKILGIFKAYKPLTFFGTLAILALFAGVFAHSHVVLGVLSGSQNIGLFNMITSAASILACLILISAGTIIHTLNFRILEMTSVLTKTCQQTKIGQPLTGEKDRS
ncbi:MAG TPA: glycosyltransferase [Candidatus Omnitrophota bacterium]|nr:glycosyltransferase [Candidatus Omnitrophota bacterium]